MKYNYFHTMEILRNLIQYNIIIIKFKSKCKIQFNLNVFKIPPFRLVWKYEYYNVGILLDNCCRGTIAHHNTVDGITKTTRK